MTLEQYFADGKGLNQTQLAKAIGTTRQAVSNWMVGKSKPKVFFSLAVEIMTGGAVPAASWLSPVQVLALDGLRSKVASGGPKRE